MSIVGNGKFVDNCELEQTNNLILQNYTSAVQNQLKNSRAIKSCRA